MQFLLSYISLFLGKWKTNALYMYVCIHTILRIFLLLHIIKTPKRSRCIVCYRFSMNIDYFAYHNWPSLFSTVVICWPPLAIIKYAYSWNWFLPSLVSQWSAPDSVLFHFYFFYIFPNVYSHFDVMATTMVVYCTYISFELLPWAIRPTSHKNSS